MYWCIWSQFVVWGPQLAAQVLHSTLFLAWSHSTFAGHPSDLQTLHYVVQSAHCLLCSNGEFSEQFLIICWRIASGAVVYRSSQQGISIWTSIFCIWGCSWWCLSILDTLQSLLPPEWVLCPDRSVLKATGLQPAAATAAITYTCLMSARDWTLWRWVHSSWHDHPEWALVLLCFRLWLCLEVKLYSCRCWIQCVFCS